MDDKKRDLIGSPARDKFKQLHKKYGKAYMYAFDLDFAFVSKYPEGIIACLDYKRPKEKIQFSQVLGFNDLIKHYPVFIIEGEDPEYGPFFLYKYLGGDYHPEPPTTKLELVDVFPDWESLILWESELRRNNGGINK